MELENLILREVKRRGRIRAAEIIKISGFSRAYVNRFLKKLGDTGKIVLIGKANTARYIPADAQKIEQEKKRILKFRKIFANTGLSEDAVLAEIKQKTGIFLSLPKNVSAILDYAFTEMLNNAIEHSRSAKIDIKMERTGDTVRFSVSDEGIGIFKNIIEKRGLKNELEAIQDLLKGKQTTAPKEHTGEGIFFTSKAADILTIKSSTKKLAFNNILKDVFIDSIKHHKGTWVGFSVNLRSRKQLEKIFKEYAGEAFEFSKTAVLARLYKIGAEYISRSQARRITAGLDKFKTVVLDFKSVKTVGQAFADEIFRVWKNGHPRIEIHYKNANENIEFMIQRAKSG